MVDFKQFCDPHSTRYSLAEPFVFNGFEYACDGRIAVRRPTHALNTEGRRIPVSIEDFFKNPVEYGPAPDPEYDGECDDCVNGVVKCDLCGHKTDCAYCMGTNKARSWIGNYAISVKYDRMIRALPILTVAMDHIVKSVRFRSGEIEGVCMAIYNDDSNTVAERDVAEQLR